MPEGGETAKMHVSSQQMHDHKVPIHVRDYCAHLVIPLNE